jgi:hypothetical protein
MGWTGESRACGGARRTGRVNNEGAGEIDVHRREDGDGALIYINYLAGSICWAGSPPAAPLFETPTLIHRPSPSGIGRHDGKRPMKLGQ